jgi:membrane protease YdiL (CAAX protease family)
MSRSWAWLQLVIGYGILEVALWTSGHTQAIASWAVAAWCASSVVAQGRSARELGVGTAGFSRALIALPVSAAASLAIISTAWAAGSLRELHGEAPVWLHALSYALWAVFQQFLLQSFFYVNLERLLGDGRKAAWITAGLFAAAHIPNPVLVPATFLAAIFFVKVFQKARNIYPLGIAHALLGLAVAISAPSGLIRNMRVGVSYFRYESAPRNVSTGDLRLPPQTWVEPHVPSRLLLE